eukprot:scaffold14707_cov129-Isochrysis_galbana.AAC.5
MPTRPGRLPGWSENEAAKLINPRRICSRSHCQWMEEHIYEYIDPLSRQNTHDLTREQWHVLYVILGDCASYFGARVQRSWAACVAARARATHAGVTCDALAFVPWPCWRSRRGAAHEHKPRAASCSVSTNTDMKIL